MSITALDIQNEGFEHSLRGYDVEQVDVFLERVAQEVDAMTTEISDLKQQLSEAKDKLAEVEAAPVADAEDLAAAHERADRAQAELEKTQSKVADALVRAEVAEGRVKAAEDRARSAEAQLKPLREKLDEKNKLDSAISEAFISAQRSADQLKEEARAEGERIYRESEAKAREFIREALAKKASILNEIEALQQSSDEFRERYLALIERFATEARENFADMEPPAVSDEEVDGLLPDIESMPGVDANLDAGEGTAPQLTTDALPQISPASE